MTVVATTPRFHYPVYSSIEDIDWDEQRWPNFKPHEFACKGTGKISINEEALDVLQELRDWIGKPFHIVSGYRSPEHNSSLRGAASTSYHMEGIAFDISMSNQDPHDFVAKAEAIGFDGIGTYPPARGNFVHVDTRGYRARWGDPF